MAQQRREESWDRGKMQNRAASPPEHGPLNRLLVVPQPIFLPPGPRPDVFMA
jgi:hypothetical protein